MQVILVSLTPLVSTKDLYRLCEPLEASGRDCTDHWTRTRPTVDAVEHASKVPTGAMPIFFIDGAELNDGALAWHFYDPLNGRPAARVYVGKSTGFNVGDSSVCELASHELVEALADARLDKWRAHPFLDDTEVALEIADPVQTHYLVQSRGEKWRLANFITPAYFDQSLVPPSRLNEFRASGQRFDWAGELRFPGDVGPSGYTTLRTPTEGGGWRLSVERAGRVPAEWSEEQRVAKEHPLSRTRLRQAVG